MTTEKKYKLNLFNDLLPALDKRDFKYYSQLSNEEKKGFAGIVALRAISGYTDKDKEMCEYFIGMANEANKHFWNPSIAKNHPELQYLTLALIGIGSPVRHEWIPGLTKKKSDNKALSVLRKYDPLASDEELQLLFDINTEEELIEMVKMVGIQDEELKEVKKVIKRLKK